MKLRIHEVAQVVGAKNDVSIFEDTQLEKAEFDSRLIGPGDLFVPLKGARDGHDFIETAFENGAAVTLSEKELANHPYILVDDVLTAFQTLAAYYLEKTAVDVFAVTGSNGKTTTKDMLAHLLSTTYKTYKTQGNYNNEIGLPTQFSICLKEQKSWSWRWGRITWEISISCLNWLVQKQPS